MVDVAQLVRAPVCGTGGRGFKSRHPPIFIGKIHFLHYQKETHEFLFQTRFFQGYIIFT